MICPNADGSESPAYQEHVDRTGLDHRLMVLSCREARARYLATLEEMDSGLVTLYMSKHELQYRLREARRHRYQDGSI